MPVGLCCSPLSLKIIIKNAFYLTIEFNFNVNRCINEIEKKIASKQCNAISEWPSCSEFFFNSLFKLIILEFAEKTRPKNPTVAVAVAVCLKSNPFIWILARIFWVAVETLKLIFYKYVSCSSPVTSYQQIYLMVIRMRIYERERSCFLCHKTVADAVCCDSNKATKISKWNKNVLIYDY